MGKKRETGGDLKRKKKEKEVTEEASVAPKKKPSLPLPGKKRRRGP